MAELSASFRGRLSVRHADGSLDEFKIKKTPIVVGRVKTNDIVILGDSAISREHCQFDFDSEIGALTIRDLGSSNGTFMNGESVGILPLPLHEGDKVQVGGTLLVLRVDSPVSLTATRVAKDKQRYGVPLAPQGGERERLVFSDGECTCGRCGATISTVGLKRGDKVGCVRCRAVWKIP